MDKWKRQCPVVPLLAPHHVLSKTSFVTVDQLVIEEKVTAKALPQRGYLVNFNSEEEYKAHQDPKSTCCEDQDKNLAHDFCLFTCMDLASEKQHCLYRFHIHKTPGQDDQKDRICEGEYKDKKEDHDVWKSQLTYSCQLNLRLMKWTFVPSLDIESLQAQRVLILGAGALGCNIARCLLGWGIHNFTFVDDGFVKLSNPVRQSLFDFEDAKQHADKASCAARHLQVIHPLVTARGISSSIPMPGHAGSFCLREVKQLIELCAEHDVIFLGTDNRESRWFPSLVARCCNKPLVNVALAFDHGVVNYQTPTTACYFCNDVLAPRNSLRNKAADEKCTVVRPGIAMLMASLAVELWMNHFQPTQLEPEKHPSQIRFSYRNWTVVTATEISPFPQCTACSRKLVTRFETEGLYFIRDVCEGRVDLEDVSGAKELVETCPEISGMEE